MILRSKLASVSLPVHGNPIQLEQVLSNLILNAMDAMSDQGHGKKVVAIETAQNRSFAEVLVTDTGPGIPPEVTGKFSSHSTPRRRREWEWAFQSFEQSLRRTGARFEPRTAIMEVRFCT